MVSALLREGHGFNKKVVMTVTVDDVINAQSEMKSFFIDLKVADEINALYILWRNLHNLTLTSVSHMKTS